MRKILNPDVLDVIIPVSIELDWMSKEEIVSAILEQNKLYGFNKFALTAPGAGWRSFGYPPKEHYKNLAKFFLEIKKEVEPYGIICGWWITLTLKSGHLDEFTGMVRNDGTKHPFANCPLDPAFRKRFSEDVADFASIAEPAFILTEDDFSVSAVDFSGYGCFCKHHLEEFARREGRTYTREELMGIFLKETPESFAMMRRWREVAKDSLVGLAEAVRKELDKKNPEIPMGYAQSGEADADGDCTEAVAKAMAGENHTPFVRPRGAFYCGVKEKDIPAVLYYVLYLKQHMKEDIILYHEADTFPHTRFYASGLHMNAIISTANSYGTEGIYFYTQQLLDDPNEEKAFSKMMLKERKRFDEVHNVVKHCEVKGVQVCYDPFWNTADKKIRPWIEPLWAKRVGIFGIPYTTVDSSVVFWDDRQAKFSDDAEVKAVLSKGLVLSGEAAKILSDRGYGKYLGVELGENAVDEMLQYDLGARDVISEKFREYGKGKNMPSVHMFACGTNGMLYKMNVIDSKCEVVSAEYTFQKQEVSPTMTRFENELGGRVVVMGMTIDANESQSLYNYRRRNLIQQMVMWCADEFVITKDSPSIFTIVNEAKNPEKSGFFGMLTLINLCADTEDEINLHLPPEWKKRTNFRILNYDGKWYDAKYSKTDDGIKLVHEMKFCVPVYIMAM